MPRTFEVLERNSPLPVETEALRGLELVPRGVRGPRRPGLWSHTTMRYIFDNFIADYHAGPVALAAGYEERHEVLAASFQKDKASVHFERNTDGDGML